MADTGDLKSPGAGRVGSNPTDVIDLPIQFAPPMERGERKYDRSSLFACVLYIVYANIIYVLEKDYIKITKLHLQLTNEYGILFS